MRWRAAVALERRRAGAVGVALAIGVFGAVVFWQQRRPLVDQGAWSSSWAGALELLGASGAAWGPLAASVAAWVGGREHRRRLGELLASTARPRWQRVTTTGLVVVAAVLAGWGLQAAVVLSAVFPAVSYGGGRWPATLALEALGIAVCAAVGFAAGRLLPGRLTAPAVGVALLALFVVVGGPGSGQPLLPVGGTGVGEGQQLSIAAVLTGTAWLGALLVLAGVAAVGRSSSRRLVGLGAAGAVAAVVSAAGVTAVAATGSWVEPDPAATALVCTTPPAGPEVCVEQVHAGLLPRVAPAWGELAQRVSTYVPVERAVELHGPSLGLRAGPGAGAAVDAVPPGVLAMPSLEGDSWPFSDGLRNDTDFSTYSNTAFEVTNPRCDATAEAAGLGGVYQGAYVAQALLNDDAAQYMDPDDPLYGRLRDDHAAASAFLAEWLPAAARCDVPVLQRLTTP